MSDNPAGATHGDDNREGFNFTDGASSAAAKPADTQPATPMNPPQPTPEPQPQYAPPQQPYYPPQYQQSYAQQPGYPPQQAYYQQPYGYPPMVQVMKVPFQQAKTWLIIGFCCAFGGIIPYLGFLVTFFALVADIVGSVLYSNDSKLPHAPEQAQSAKIWLWLAWGIQVLSIVAAILIFAMLIGVFALAGASH